MFNAYKLTQFWLLMESN